MAAVWFLYMLRCRDGTLYTGIATDVARRLAEHEGAGPRGARYLRGRGPLQLALSLAVGPRGDALRLEHRVKRLGRAAKEELINRPESARDLLREAPPC